MDSKHEHQQSFRIDSVPMVEAVLISGEDGLLIPPVPVPMSVPSAPGRESLFVNLLRSTSKDPLPNYSGACNTEKMRHFLEDEQFPPGLVEQCVASTQKFPMRFFVCDDSGSMMTMDGNMVRPDPKVIGGGVNFQCSRWEELGSSMKFHAKLALASETFCQFRFLNGPTIQLPDDGDKGFEKLNDILNSSPGGSTPICQALLEVERTISKVADTLRANHQIAVITIFTDGEATDGNLVIAMRPLQLLPVWVVIRLSTDESKIVRYWDNVDDELEIQIDVLDDLTNEAKQVQDRNPFIVYTDAFHKMREWGMHLKEFDHIDERQLTLDQAHRVVAAVLGKEMVALLPVDKLHTDLNVYIAALKKIFKGSQFRKVHNMITHKPDTWISADQMAKTYGKKGCVIM